MAFPDADRSIVAEAKIREYLLNRDHPEGGSKARWFYSLGYNLIDWELLAIDLLAIARNCTNFDTERSRFGIKYKARGLAGRAGHRSDPVMTVWIVEDADPPRLVTAYPDDIE